MRSLVVAVVLWFVAVTNSLAAQCTPLGNPCASSGMSLACSTPPQIGTNWVVSEVSAASCGGAATNPVPMLTAIGNCFDAGIPLNPPLVCANCTGCVLHVVPIDVMVQWAWPPRSVTIPIPNVRQLVGALFCVQNFCVHPTNLCVCASGAAQVIILP